LVLRTAVSAPSLLGASAVGTRTLAGQSLASPQLLRLQLSVSLLPVSLLPVWLSLDRSAEVRAPNGTWCRLKPGHTGRHPLRRVQHRVCRPAKGPTPIISNSRLTYERPRGATAQFDRLRPLRGPRSPAGTRIAQPRCSAGRSGEAEGALDFAASHALRVG
jgi:hypothetical protein